MTDVPAHLRAIVDRAAGREHSAGGAVMRCLAEVLAVHERDVLRRATAAINADPWDCDGIPGNNCECFNAGMAHAVSRIDPDMGGAA